MEANGCDEQERAERLDKADRLLAAAEALLVVLDDLDLDDAYVRLCLQAGLAGADVLCCRGLGARASGRNPVQAITLLGRVDEPASDRLRLLVSMQAKAEFRAGAISAEDRRSAEQAAAALVAAARSG